MAYEAGRLHESRSRIPLNVAFHWDLFTTRYNHTADTLVEHAARIVERYRPSVAGDHVLLRWEELKDSPLEGVVHAIHMWRLPEGSENFWVSGESGGVDVEPAELQTLIDRKNAKVDSYLQKCHSDWPLIVPGDHISETAHLTEAVHHHVFRSRFARVVFYDPRGGAWGRGAFTLPCSR